MKKTLLLTLGIIACLTMTAEPFSVRVNGKTDYPATNTGEKDFQDRVQYAATGITLNAGDKLTCFDAGSSAEWNIGVIDQYGAYQNFSTGSDALTCNKAGTYNVYIKMKMNDDMWYIEEANDGQQGGGDNPGGDNPGGSGGVEGNPRYYYKGYIDGQDVEPSEETIFDHGVAEIEFTTEAYLFVLYQVDGYPGVQYMTAEYVGDQDHATLLTTGGQKWKCPEGTTLLYLYDNGNGSLEISAKPIPGKKLADPQPDQSAVENTTIQTNITKTIINGQVVIIKDGVRYNLLGAQLQ